MMTKSKSTLFSRLKLLSAIPVVFLLVMAFTASPTMDIFGQTENELPEGVKFKEIKGRETGSTNNEPLTGDVYSITEVLPEFPGGKDRMMRYLASKINYPEKAREEGKEGTVYVQFIVEKDGAISNAIVLRGFDKACDKVALDAVMSMPKWDPGRENGEPVRVQFNVPIKFSLDGEKEIKNVDRKQADPESPPPPPKKEKK